MKRLSIVAFALATLGALAVAPASQANAGPRCGPHAHWVAGHWAYGPHGHRYWVAGRCV